MLGQKIKINFSRHFNPILNMNKYNISIILKRYREKDSKFTNWIELPVNPPDARKIQIHDLNANTRYEFQVIGTNEYGDGMFSEIIEASTKGKQCLN